MREIKFRGYDKDLRKWHYGNYYFYTDTIYCVASDKDHEENEHHCILFDGFCDWDMPRPHYKSFVDKNSIGQFTGLTDKNGKEIYEGDICIVSLSYFSIEDEKATVIFHNGAFQFQYGCEKFFSKPHDAWDEVDVIGNIYENPELI